MEFQKVSKNCLKEWFIIRIVLLVFVLLPLALILLIPTTTDEELIGKVITLSIYGSFSLWMLIYSLIFPKLQYDRMKYRITPTMIEQYKGVIFLRKQYVPFVRIQHVEVFRGVFDRIFKMSTLLIFTAGSMLRIRNLDIDKAEELVAHIKKTLIDENFGDVND